MGLAEIDKKIYEDPETGCWVYTGSLRRGYGQTKYNGKTTGIHRIAYELANGPVPDGLHVDHLCRNRACCNPAHLEAVTPLENIRRSPIHNGAKEKCKNGHPYTPANTGRSNYKGKPKRFCRVCQRKCNSIAAAKRRARLKDAA